MPALTLEEHPQHVLDLPQLYTKPASTTILQVLAALEVKPPSWNRKQLQIGQNYATTINPKGLSQYLTSIIASPLSWLKDDETRELIWEAASARLSERSGRTAMKSIDRTFEISTENGTVDITLHEPSLTSDNLGFKTWAASYLLAQRLHKLQLPVTARLRALELGSGTGLVGMAAAAVLGMDVYVTDLPEIHPNLSKNVNQNMEVICHNDGNTTTGILDWQSPHTMRLARIDGSFLDRSFDEHFPLIVAADTIYSESHPAMLTNVIALWLAKSKDSRVVFELPRRAGYEKELRSLSTEMHKAGLMLLEEDDEFGYDDWGSDEDDKARIQCWFSVWAWKL